MIFAGSSGYIDDMPVNEVPRFEHDLLAFVEAHTDRCCRKIATKKALDDEIRERVEKDASRIQGTNSPPESARPAGAASSRLSKASSDSMPTQLDLKRRIRSVKNTQQITRAMKFVAAARLRRAQEKAFAARPYARALVTRACTRP